MQKHPLGRTGLFVSELCLGTMTFGGTDGISSQIGGLQQADAERLVGQAIDAGINFIDTADVYAGGVSEQITGQALKNLKVPRENVVGWPLFIYWSFETPDDQYTKTAWSDRLLFLGRVVIHFFDETRWGRTLRPVR